MTFLFHEVARQHAANTRAFLAQRRSSRIAVITFAYLLVAVMGVAVAALVADNSRGNVALVAAVVAAVALIVALLVSRRRIRRIEKTLDQSLDAIAATRAMANQANIPSNEQDQIRDIFYELHDWRSRDLFGRKRTLL